ncbi:unnamed protein product [Oreochromis niloticus]|nr:unnamed protein product [Mustela putorius furo]
MRVQEGVRKTITEFELKATDADTEASNSLYELHNINRCQEMYSETLLQLRIREEKHTVLLACKGSHRAPAPGVRAPGLALCHCPGLYLYTRRVIQQ